MARGRIGTLRVNFLWFQIEPRRGARRWGVYDLIVRTAARAGITVLPVFLGSPSFANRNPRHPPRSRRARAAFARFVIAAARRYGRRGSFWRANRRLPYRPLTVWQVWNEVNLNFFWNGRASPREYASLLRLTRGALDRVDRRAKIVLAGLPEGRGGNLRRAAYLRSLYRVPGARRLFDAVAIHPYVRDERGVTDAVADARREMRRFRDARTPLWITELGWATAGERTPYTVSRSRQAQLLARALRLVVARRRADRIERVIWFAWRDQPKIGPRDHWTFHTGLFDLFGYPKPAWRALMRFTRGSAGKGGLFSGVFPPPVVITPPPPPPGEGEEPPDSPPGGPGGPSPCTIAPVLCPPGTATPGF